MTIKDIKAELDNKGICYKGITKKQELLNLIPEYQEARKEQGYLTERGLYWLKINLANTLGYDKLLFPERIEKAEKVIASITKNDNYQFFEDRADSPIEFRNCWNDYLSHLRGEPVESFMYLDASNQAFQLYAVLTSDKKTAELCNLANGEALADAYGEVADTMNSESGLSVFNRSNCKKGVMTTLYSKMNVGQTILDESQLFDTTPLDFEADDIDELFQHSFQIVAPEAKEAMEALLALNDPKIGTYYWTMPDGGRVKYDVKSNHKIHIEGTTNRGIHIYFNQEVKRYAPSEFNRGMSPNVIHSFDGWIIREIERKWKHFLTTIHDAFGVHYNYADELRALYLDIMCDLNSNDYLKGIMEEISGAEQASLKKGTLTNEDIRGSVYFLA